MSLGQGLIAAGLAKPQDIAFALERQRSSGGTLGENLAALEVISREQLEAFLQHPPPQLLSIADTGLKPSFLMTLALKLMHTLGLDTAGATAREIRLPVPVVGSILKLLQERTLIDPMVGLSPTAEVRYSVSARGREWVQEALRQSEYVGPAPVTLATYHDQVERQRITNDRLDRDAIAASLSGLVLPDDLVDRLGPVVNSGRAFLLHGPPGNGKTSIAVALAQSFRQWIYVPYAIEVDGQVIKVFDPAIHREVEPPHDAAEAKSRMRLMAEDRRWARCRRPISIVGGELSLDMLELGFNPQARHYEAPLHIKGNGGVFVVDDFGRQIDRPEKILNRWTLALESGVDYLTLQTGRKFGVRFDGLVIFSTNIPPSEIMDAAMLRRIPYKFAIEGPSREDYVLIFERVCAEKGIAYDPAVVAALIERLYGRDGLPMARFHPRFIVEHVLARCRFLGRAAVLDPEMVFEAAEHLGTAR